MCVYVSQVDTGADVLGGVRLDVDVGLWGPMEVVGQRRFVVSSCQTHLTDLHACECKEPRPCHYGALRARGDTVVCASYRRVSLADT